MILSGNRVGWGVGRGWIRPKIVPRRWALPPSLLLSALEGVTKVVCVVPQVIMGGDDDDDVDVVIV